MSEHTFIDPLEELINKHRAAEKPAETQHTTETPVIEQEPEQEELTELERADLYGDEDLNAEIEQEDRAREEARLKAFEQLKGEETPGVRMPPDEHDPQYHTEAINYQTDKIAVVTTMVNKVIASHHLITGGIPDEKRMAVMGELIEIYHKTGDVITPEFEQMILDNWEGPDSAVTPETEQSEVSVNEEQTENPVVPTININVDADAPPVTINVDESVTSKMTETNEINIHVKHVSEEELLKSIIIENSQQEGIITAYDSGINDVPITLPLSGYRCVMRPINWFDFIRLTAPTSQNAVDNELKKWSVIYQHMKNPSIGPFKDFDDFLKKTKYQDKELLMWAILVATANEEETVSFPCPNKKCGNPLSVQYRPRTLISLDEKLIPDHYTTTHSVAVGDPAIKHWESINGKRTRYLLPTTKIIAEINEPSAHEFITVKLPLIQDLYERYRPGESMAGMNVNDPSMMEFDYLSANALFITAMTIVRDGKEYRYTNWEDIETIITEGLDADDSGILLKIIEKARADVSPVSFHLSDVECPKCKNKIKRYYINDIGNQLLFQVSRRLASTTVNLIEMP